MWTKPPFMALNKLSWYYYLSIINLEPTKLPLAILDSYSTVTLKLLLKHFFCRCQDYVSWSVIVDVFTTHSISYIKNKIMAQYQFYYWLIKWSINWWINNDAEQFDRLSNWQIDQFIVELPSLPCLMFWYCFLCYKILCGVGIACDSRCTKVGHRRHHYRCYWK